MSRIKRLINENTDQMFLGIIVSLSIIFFMIINVFLNNILRRGEFSHKDINAFLTINAVFIFMITCLFFIFIYFLRKNIVLFSNASCELIDKLLNKESEINFDIFNDTLFSKLQSKLKQLFDVLQNDKRLALEEKESIKIFLENISHQIKTPMANITMYNDTLIQRELPKEKSLLFLNNMKFQVKKLEWLVESLIKMSRLDSNMMVLSNNKSLLNDTIADALSNIYFKADEKKIDIKVNLEEMIFIKHDRKWTSEAIFNILENAVKYTKSGGNIEVKLEKWELFSKIDVIDTGIVIFEDDIHKVFKRFYRAEEVTMDEGVGIGLYLSNEIITKQGGYIKLFSKKDKGSIFSIFLKN